MSRVLITFAAVAVAEEYQTYEGKTCWNGHGAVEIDSDSSAPVGLNEDSCKARCDADAACDCVAFQPSAGKCWKRKSCVPDQFGADGNFNTYVKMHSPAPSPPPPSPTPTPSPSPGGKNCLCIFDIDRTLTGKQGDTSKCPANSVQRGVYDSAYDRGDLTLSELTQKVAGTFCSACHLGTISAGDASGDGSAERAVLHDSLAVADSDLPSEWSKPGCSVTSPLVTSCDDGQKQNAVPGIIDWYRQNEGAQIADSDVHFFDDRSENIEPFRATGYNARQISCATRDRGGSVGYCGAVLSEITADPGVAVCGEVRVADDAVLV